MKPDGYIKKFHLEDYSYINFTKFAVELERDFDELLGMNDATNNYGKFKQCVCQIRQKYDSINLKIPKQLPKELWSYFYSRVIVDRRKVFFPDIQKKIEEYNQKNKKIYVSE